MSTHSRLSQDSSLQPTYMGDNWEEFAELADGVIVVGPDQQELPVHSIELAKHSKVCAIFFKKKQHV
jgi:hypothetical protein